MAVQTDFLDYMTAANLVVGDTPQTNMIGFGGVGAPFLNGNVGAYAADLNAAGVDLIF
jgi:hypothetical protein